MGKQRSILEVIDLCKDYEGKPLLDGISFNVTEGETLCLLGRSGSGKSTTLRIIAGIETADSGKILWNGVDQSTVQTYKRNFGFMFQDYALFPHMTVAENVGFGLRMKDTPRQEAAGLIHEALNLVNMRGFEGRRVTDLSGGEQQRIALARALAPRPRLLMLDEPLAALDRSLRMELQDELRALLHKTGIPAIYVTHDQEEAVILGDRIAILMNGKIEQAGSAESVYKEPQTRLVAEFLGMTNFIAGVISSAAPLAVLTKAGEFHPGASNLSQVGKGNQATILIKNDRVELVNTRQSVNCLCGTVSDCVYRGSSYLLTIAMDDGLFFKFSIQEPVKIGDVVHLKFPSTSIICY